MWVIEPDIFDLRIEARILMMQMGEEGKCHLCRRAFFGLVNEMAQG